MYQLSEGETYPLEISVEATLAASTAAGAAGLASLYREYIEENQNY